MKNYHWVLLGLFLSSGGLLGWNMIRGLRNNNPGNLRRTSDNWQGLDLVQTDSEFFQFMNPKMGIRALAKTLRTYQDRHGLRTVRKIISRWAPSSENDTEAYIMSVAGQLDVNPSQILHRDKYLKPLVKAIIKHENGMNPYREVTINEAIAMV